MQDLQDFADTRPEARDDIALLVDVATRFHLHGESQVRIARELGLSPSTVSRYLKRARELGIVQVHIAAPSTPDVDLGRKLAGHFKLQRAIVAPARAGSLARVAADYINRTLTDGMRVGISWGSTLLSVVRNLQAGLVANLELVQLVGGMGFAAPGIQGHEILTSLARLYPGTRTHYLQAPVFVGSAETRDLMLAEDSIQSAFHAARHCRLAIVGIGALGEDSSMVRYGHLQPADRERLLLEGAVGDICGRFFRSDGSPASEDLDRRTIAISWEELRAIPTVVAVAAGAHKVAAVRGALRTGCVDVLITDEPTARQLLGEERDHAAPGFVGKGLNGRRRRDV